MVRNINKDINLLKIKATKATIEDTKIANDLRDTLLFNQARCVGMAANMIGEYKAIIAFFDDDGKIIIMYNPKIIHKLGEYDTKEGCLSLEGQRATKRHKKIKVEYENENFLKRIKTFNDFTAEIIEHEIDHLNGIII